MSSCQLSGTGGGSWGVGRAAKGTFPDRVLVLEGGDLDTEGIPAENVKAWRMATHRLTLTEEERGLPEALRCA
jgi:hypothetical protein